MATRRGWWASVREALSGSEQDFTRGSLNRGVILLAIPMTLEMVMESVFAVVDIFFVARLGEDAIAAVGLTEGLLTLLYAVAIGLSMGTTALVSRRWGEGDRRGAASTTMQAIAIGIAVSAVVAVVGGWTAPDLLRLMAGSQAEGVVEVGSAYTRILLITNVVIMLLFLNNAAFRGAGDASLAMRTLWLANGINLVLDPCLIFGLGPFPELGLEGAAIATSIGRGTAVACQLWLLLRGSGRLDLRGLPWIPDLAEARSLLRVSAGGILQFLVETASFVVLVRLVSVFGSTAVAGYTIGIRIIIFVIMPSWGLSNAAATLVGQNLGANEPARAERSVWLTGFYNMAFLGVLSVVFIVWARPLVEVFTTDEAIVTAGIDCLRTISYGYVFFAWGMVTVQCFNGAGDTMTPTWVNLFCYWLFQIPLAWALSLGLGWGPPGVYWAIAISYSLSAVVGIWLFRRGRWKEQAV